MDIQYIPSSLYYHLKNHGNLKKAPSSWEKCYQQNITNCCKFRITFINAYAYCHLQGGQGSSPTLKFSAKKPTKRKKCIVQLKEEPLKVSKKKRTIAGAVALIISPNIGSGIVALPQKTSPAVISLPKNYLVLLGHYHVVPSGQSFAVISGPRYKGLITHTEMAARDWLEALRGNAP